MPAQTIFVGSLPPSASNERLEEIFSEIGPVKQCFVVREKGTEKCRGFGYVTFSMEEDAQRAMKEVKEYDGRRLSVSVAKKKIKEKKKTAPKEGTAAPEKNQQPRGFRKKQLKARLIIRNLSFKCSEDDLKEVFAKFGTVLEAKIPLKPDGKMRGFAFVMFKSVAEAAKALNVMNLKDIKGRQVAVDWAVPKDQFISTQQSSAAGDENVKVETTKQSDADSDPKVENDNKKKAAPEKKSVASKSAEPQVDESLSDDEDDSEEHDSEDEEDDDDVSDEGDDNDHEEEEGDDDEEEDDDDDDDEEDDDDDDDDDDECSFDSDGDEEEEESKSARKKTSKKILSSDVNEGRTVFIRNLSFDTEEEGLEEVLLQYGELNYIKIVIHPDTEHSKGCAFAQFKTKEAADRCIAAAQDENGGVRVDGRKLLIVAAVSKEDAAKLNVNKVKVETGTRNLYLAREGLIRAGTKAAEGVPETDMIKRTRFEEIKRTKLRDMNVFVSKTRLCVHNLPKSVDNKKLKALCFQAVKGAKGVRITECRVMYDRKPQKGQVMGQSLGYGFVQFHEHEHALATLRFLNNNPDIFGSHKRPIVEFSLEDSRKLKLKEMRQQKNKEFLQKSLKQGAKPDLQTSGDDKGPGQVGSKRKSTLEQTDKQRASPQSQKKIRQYAGFQTNPEVEHVDLENGKKRKKVLPLPSHRGPKIRMRDKGKQQAPPPKKAGPGSKRRERQRRQMEKPTQPRNQNVKAAKKHFKSRGGDHFDNLVEQYKKKLMGNHDKNTSIRRSKWFEG